MTLANIDFLQCHKPNIGRKTDGLYLRVWLDYGPMRATLLAISKYAPAGISSNYMPDSRLELRDFPHNAQKPNICGQAQNNGLNFV
jgi:hypothetical protein